MSSIKDIPKPEASIYSIIEILDQQMFEYIRLNPLRTSAVFLVIIWMISICQFAVFYTSI